MGDMPLLIGIVVFWFLLGISLSAIASDSALSEISVGNTTTIISSPGAGNYSDLEANTGATQTSWIKEFFRMFTFSIGSNSGFPVIISVIVGFVNYLLLLILILIGYRLLRSGSG